MVDLGAVNTLGPDALGGPRDWARGSLPFGIAEGVRAGRVLLLSRNIVIENLVRPVVGPQVARVCSPVQVGDERGARREGAVKLASWKGKDVDTLVVGGDGQVLGARGEFHILQPVLHWALSGDPHLPGADLVDPEAPATEPDGAEAALRVDIHASGLRCQCEFPRLRVWRKWTSVLVAIEVDKSHELFCLGTPDPQGGVVTHGEEAVGSRDRAEPPDLVRVLELWSVVALDEGLRLLGGRQLVPLEGDTVDLAAKGTDHETGAGWVDVDSARLPVDRTKLGEAERKDDAVV